MKPSIIIAIIFLVIQINVHATLGTVPYNGLQLNGEQLIEDQTLSLEWTRDANLAKTLCNNQDPLWIGFDPTKVVQGTGRTGSEICTDGGRMNWYEAQAWLKHLNDHNYLGHSNWRLPEISYQDASCSDQVVLSSADVSVSIGRGCKNGEPGHLKAALNDYRNTFKNFGDQIYWSSTELAADKTLAGVFGIENDWQDAEEKTSDLLPVWPVHSL
ncbi:Lcl domain-containing protein [Thiolapillus sp.]